jgi:hypothetical protein
MRKFFLMSFVLITLIGISSKAQTNQKFAPGSIKEWRCRKYYFHMTTRCVTCKTVEAEARKNVEMLYADPGQSAR